MAPRGSARRAGSRSGLDAAHGDDRTVATHDLDRRKAGLDDDALALSCLDLLDLRRHLRSTTSIDDRHRGGAAPPGRPSPRPSAVLPPPTTMAGPRQSRLFAEVDLLQEERRRHDPGCVVAADPQPSTLRGAGGQEDRSIALGLEIAEGEVPTHRRVQPEIHAQADDRAISACRTSRGSR